MDKVWSKPGKPKAQPKSTYVGKRRTSGKRGESTMATIAKLIAGRRK